MSESSSKPSLSTENRWPLKGALTLYTVETVRDQLLPQLKPGSALDLDLQAVDSCDCAGLQLLCSARKSASTQNTPLTISNLSPAVVAAAESIGLDTALFTTPSTHV